MLNLPGDDGLERRAPAPLPDVAGRAPGGPQAGKEGEKAGPVDGPVSLFVHRDQLAEINGWHGFHQPYKPGRRNMAALRATYYRISKPQSLWAWIVFVLYWPARRSNERAGLMPIMGGAPWPPSGGSVSVTAAAAGVGDFIAAHNGTSAYAINGRTGAIASTSNSGHFDVVWNYIIAQFEQRGVTSTGSSTAITSASWAGGVATYTHASGKQPYPGQYVTVSGVTPGGYNQTGVVTTCTLTTFTIPLASNPGAFTGAGTWQFAASAGGMISISNLSGNNQRIPFYATLNTCDGLQVHGSGLGKTGQGTPFEDTGSTVLQATAPFVSSTTLAGQGALWAVGASDGIVGIDARGGYLTAGTGGREQLSIIGVSIDGNSVIDVGIVVLGKGTGNAAWLEGMQIERCSVNGMQIGSTVDSAGSSDVYMSFIFISQNATSGGSGATANSLLAIYCGDSIINYCNFAAPQGNNSYCVYQATGGVRTQVTNCHIGGGASSQVRYVCFGGQNTLISHCYIDNITSTTAGIYFKALGSSDAGAGSVANSTISWNYFNLNTGAVACIGLDGTSSANFQGVTVSHNIAAGDGVGNQYFVAFTALGGTKQIVIEHNHGKDIFGVYSGTLPADTLVRRNGGFVSGLATAMGGYQHTPVSLAAASGSITTVDTVVLSYKMWPGWNNQGDFYRITCHFTITATATNTVTLNVRLGTAGTTADAVITSVVATMGATVTQGAVFECIIGWRSGAVTTSKWIGNCELRDGTGQVTIGDTVSNTTAQATVDRSVTDFLSLTVVTSNAATSVVANHATIEPIGA